MLRPTNDLLNLTISASDGTIGDVKDLYIDDESWTIRYLVVDVGSWLSSSKGLISPIAADKPDWTSKVLPVSLTREQVKHSPDVDTDMPVTRQHETENLDYYSYPHYWGGMGLSPASGYSGMRMPGAATATLAEVDKARTAQARTQAQQRDQDTNLRSCKAVVGYDIKASDGEIGHVQGLLIDEESWVIRFLVVSTSNWWLGHDVLLAPQWIKRVNWAEQTVVVDLNRDALKEAPSYDAAKPLSREMEIPVYKHYGREGYWLGAAPASGRVAHSRVYG